MALNGYSVLVVVPPAPEVLVEIKKNCLRCVLPFILQLELSHNAIENKVLL